MSSNGPCDWPQKCTYEEARAHFVATLLGFGIEQQEARCEADLALQHVTKLAAHELLLNAKTRLPDADSQALAAILGKRRKRVPLQYVLGETYFCGLKFAVGPGVLIPRGDTETLVLAASEFIKGRDISTSLLEVGAGSGAIVVTLLKLFPQLVATAFEISPQAAHFCRVNAICHGVAERLTLIEDDYLEGLAKLAPSNRFDLFLSNPPYIPIDVAAGLAPEVIGHEPRLALVAGVDGLGFYRNFAKLLPGLEATAHAALMVEFGDGQGESLTDLFGESGWCDLHILSDLGGRPRVLTSSGCR